LLKILFIKPQIKIKPLLAMKLADIVEDSPVWKTLDIKAF
jgi:hypothetical protein